MEDAAVLEAEENQLEDQAIKTDQAAAEQDMNKESTELDERIQVLEEEQSRKKRFCNKISQVMAEREALKLEYSQLGKDIKKCTDQIESLLSEFIAEQASTPLLEWRNSKKSDAENRLPVASDAWRAWKIVEFFQLTEKQYEKLGLAEDSTIGELADMIAKLANGDKKIAGVGQGFIDKINEQFDVFWQMPEYKALSNPTADVDNETNEPSEQQEPETEYDDYEVEEYGNDEANDE